MSELLNSCTPELQKFLLIALAAMTLFYIYYYTRYLAGVQRRVRHQTNHRFRWREQPVPEAPNQALSPQAERLPDDTGRAASAERGNDNFQFSTFNFQFPPVSVIVCARNEEDNLRHFLQALCCQKYPTFEVIVVNDGSEDNTQTVLEHYTQLFRNLRLTFVPNQAWVRSSKKLALTLAAKAAKYDYLLLTDADCRPESPYWIEEMMRGFSRPETEVVIGYGGYFEEPTAINRLIQYDTIYNAMTYLGFALSGHPYMGVGRNLAYKKSTFFANHGFAGQLGQRAGDDDLFVNKVATRHNTEVVLTPGSYTWSIPKHSYAEWRLQKYRHLSVSPAYRLSTKLRLTIEPLIRGLWYLLMIAIVVLATQGILTDPILWAAAGGLFVARHVWLMLLTNRAAHIFGVHGVGLRGLLYDIFLPLFNLHMLIRHHFRRNQPQHW